MNGCTTCGGFAGRHDPIAHDAEPQERDVQLAPAEAQERGLPLGGCCCPEHPHSWYERTRGADVWLECSHCADALTRPDPGRC